MQLLLRPNAAIFRPSLSLILPSIVTLTTPRMILKKVAPIYIKPFSCLWIFLTRDPHLLIINRACFLTFLLKPSRQIPVMVVRVYLLIHFLQYFQQVAIMVRLARETRGIQLSWKYCRINLSAPVLVGSTLVPIWVDVFVTICADLGLGVTTSN